ncbi:hypothetical protein [Amycolatopsis sp. H20-H5]|uniref:hypothetical protein n=1 Tax=Amycolatopsis sp. H20-H5 TaxID=3046309 RepID=UPI002DBAA708|nr:hypothetical protein [Amycolatopsis sp. H20-H5]MEC3973855.1 hypothetical protein [Amycolatopsis sp. H20-H5]
MARDTAPGFLLWLNFQRAEFMDGSRRTGFVRDGAVVEGRRWRAVSAAFWLLGIGWVFGVPVLVVNAVTATILLESPTDAQLALQGTLLTWAAVLGLGLPLASGSLCW